jgi:hypothetical protein
LILTTDPRNTDNRGQEQQSDTEERTPSSTAAQSGQKPRFDASMSPDAIRGRIEERFAKLDMLIEYDRTEADRLSRSGRDMNVRTVLQ